MRGLAKPLQKQSYVKFYGSASGVYQYPKNKYAANIRPALNTHKKIKKNYGKIFLSFLLKIVFSLIFVVYVIPVYIDTITRPVVLHAQKYPDLKTDYNQLYRPTGLYLHNNHFLGVNFLSSVEIKKPLMQPLYETYHLTSLENNIKLLASKYPTLKPSVYVWDYESGKHADFNSNDVFSAASIIKIPVLIQLFKAIEMGMIKLDDKIAMSDLYKSEGSGSLQFKGVNAVYTVDDLARVMITESDNSATNMLLDATGGMNALNQSLRKWGMKTTRINDWLPDLKGTNVTTSKEMATLLYNIDNPNFLSLSSREKMVDYMSHVHNNRLIQAGLSADAIFMHKTGDIGKMLGDAGIVYTPNGKKYIVVMLVNRPYNSPEGKNFIVEASSLIYKYMTNVTL